MSMISRAGAEVSSRPEPDAKANSPCPRNRQDFTLNSLIVRRLLRLLQLFLAIASLLLWGEHSIAFDDFMNEGTRISDVTHGVELDQHGSIAYITLHQSHVLTGLTIAAASCFVVAALVGKYVGKHFPAQR